jgi:hypothetical protein
MDGNLATVLSDDQCFLVLLERGKAFGGLVFDVFDRDEFWKQANTLVGDSSIMALKCH